jgi:hypothetical protein
MKLDTVIDAKWLQDNDACCKDDKRVLKIIGKGKTLKQLLPKFDRADWLLWTLKRTTDSPKIFYVRCAILCAEEVIGIYEKKYPDDKRPRLAIEAAIAYANNPSEENRIAAANAANAAYDAAYAYVAYAAYAAAYVAYAAYAAADAANAAYADAADAADAAYAYADAAAAYADAADAAYAASAAYASAAYADAADAYAADADAYAADADANAARTKMHKKLCKLIIKEIARGI